MIVLDTDHLNHLQLGKGTAFESLTARMGASSDQGFVATVISLEESMRGWLAAIRRCKKLEEQIFPYTNLISTVRFFEDWRLLRFDSAAIQYFASLRAQRIRISTMDLKIASIVLANDSILLSANMRDFDEVPNLRVENWLV